MEALKEGEVLASSQIQDSIRGFGVQEDIVYYDKLLYLFEKVEALSNMK